MAGPLPDVLSMSAQVLKGKITQGWMGEPIIHQIWWYGYRVVNTDQSENK